MTTTYFIDVDRIEPSDSALRAAPMSHGSGLYILPHVAAMALQILPESKHFDPAGVYSLFKQHRGVKFLLHRPW